MNEITEEGQENGTEEETENFNWSGLKAYSIVDEDNQLVQLGKKSVLSLIFCHFNF